ncbi:MAG: hypothetical protein AAB518_00270 [Patescibacteria group bacterium]
MTRNLYGFGDYNTNQVRKMAVEVEAEGFDATQIYRRRPDAASEPKKVIREMPLSDIPFIIPDAFAGSLGTEIVSAFSLTQLEKIGTDGEEYLKGAIRIALEAAKSTNPNDEHIQKLLRYVTLSPAWQV